MSDARPVDKRWVKLRAGAIAAVKTLTQRLRVDDIPVSLAKLCKRIARVEFRPLLTDGGLAHDGQSFVIYVDSAEREPETLQQQFEGPEGGARLPLRMRFTIAHEMAHTYLFDVKDGKALAKVDLTVADEGERVEALCNELAGMLLVPEGALAQLIREEQRHLYDPEDICAIAERFRVSSQALILAIRDLRELSGADGIILYVSTEAETPLVVSATMTGSARLLLRDAKMTPIEGKPLTNLLDNASSLRVFGGAELGATTELAYERDGRRWTRRMKVKCKEDRAHFSWVVACEFMSLDGKKVAMGDMSQEMGT